MTSDPHNTAATPLAQWARAAAAGGLAGLLLALFDFALLGFHPDARMALPYAMAITTLAGVAAGCVLGALRALGSAVFSGPGQRRISALPLALAAGGLIYYLNQDLFSGAAVSRKSWAPMAEQYGIPLMAAVAAALVLFLAPLPSWKKGRKGLFALGLAGGFVLMGLANLGWGPFGKLNNYPSLKMQFTAFTFLAAFLLLLLPFLRMPGRGRPSFVLATVLCVAALFTGFEERGRTTIFQVRSAISGQPFPATTRLMTLVESRGFDYFNDLPEISSTVEIDPNDLINAADAQLSQKALAQVAPKRSQFNVVWIAVDALRADHLGCYGFDRNTSPAIDAFAAESVIFERALTPTPASNFAYSGTLSGLVGRTSEAYFKYYKAKSPVPDDHSLASLLKKRGRFTAAVTSFARVVQDREDFRVMDHGFASFNEDGHEQELDGRKVTDLGIRLLDRAKMREGKPFFLFLHYMDPHGPYTFHPEYQFGSRAIDAYDSEIAYCDKHIGRFLEALKERDLDQNTVVIFFADHGESFGEHNQLRHGTALYQHQTHVPLIVRFPGLPPRRIREWVTLSDLTPTTLALLGMKDPVRRLGRDLTPLMTATAKNWVDVAYSERPSPPKGAWHSKERGIWSGDLKLLWKPEENTFQVFDLKNDPGELKNIFDHTKEEQARLLALMKAWDTRIDSFWGKSAGTPDVGPTEDKLKDTFRTLVTAFAEASSDKDKKAAALALGDFLKAKPFRWKSAVADRLDAGDLDRLRRLSEERLGHVLDKAGERDLLARILIFCDMPQSQGAVKKALDKSRNPFIVFELARYLARHQDKSVAPLLRQALEKASWRDKLKAAEALAQIGDGAGRDLLAAAMLSQRITDIAAGARGMAHLNDPALFEHLLFTENTKWRNQDVLDSIVEAAGRDKTPLGTATLIQLTMTASETGGARARKLLEERLTPEQIPLISRVFETVFGAWESMRYGKWENALKPMQNLSAEEEALMGPLLYLRLRLGRLLERDELIQDSMKSLEKHSGEVGFVKDLLRRFKAGQITSPTLIDYQNSGLTCRIKSFRYDDPPRSHSPWIVTYELENTSPLFIEGGDMRGCLHIGAAEVQGEGYKVPTKLLQPLPISGLAPGEKRTFAFFGRFPAKKGPWMRDLVVILTANSRKPVKLAELPRLKVK